MFTLLNAHSMSFFKNVLRLGTSGICVHNNITIRYMYDVQQALAEINETTNFG